MTGRLRPNPLRAAPLLAAAVATAFVTAAHAAAPRPLPTAGNWETVGADTGSFRLVVRHGGGRAAVAIEDAVFTLPESCNDRTGSEPLILRRPTVRVASSGRFSGRWVVKSSVADTVDTFAGRIRGGTATVSTRSQSSGPRYGGGGTETCDTGTVALTLEPTPRVPVPDGDWTGQAQNGEAVALHVEAGGRLLDMKRLPLPVGFGPSFSVGSWTTDCPTGGGWCQSNSGDGCARQLFTTAFIGPQGTVSLPGGLRMPAVTMQFTGGSAVGRLTYPAEDAACSTAWTAKPAP